MLVVLESGLQILITFKPQKPCAYFFNLRQKQIYPHKVLFYFIWASITVNYNIFPDCFVL